MLPNLNDIPEPPPEIQIILLREERQIYLNTIWQAKFRYETAKFLDEPAQMEEQVRIIERFHKALIRIDECLDALQKEKKQ